MNRPHAAAKAISDGKFGTVGLLTSSRAYQAGMHMPLLWGLEQETAAQDLRLSELESEMRRRVEDLRSDIEAERGVLEARLQELLRRYASAAAVRGS